MQDSVDAKGHLKILGSKFEWRHGLKFVLTHKDKTTENWHCRQKKADLKKKKES